MENHRLKPMSQGYDSRLFNELYANTKPLRKKLAYQINPSYLGVDRDMILSWFDDKFIFAFNKYQTVKTPDLLKAHIIQSLQFFKCRVLRYTQTQKNSVNKCTIDVDSLLGLSEPAVGFIYDETPYLLKLANQYMREHLSRAAFEVYMTEINPPLYILSRLKDNDSTAKIPSNLMADYLGLDNSKVNLLRKEIRHAIDNAHRYFAKKSV